MPLTRIGTSLEHEVIHGNVVCDPFRWLEDRNSSETEAWLKDQALRCTAYFSECDGLNEIRSRVREYVDVEMADQPAKTAGRYFYRLRKRGQEQACLYVQDATSGRVRLLVDPSEQGPFVSVGIHRISADGSLLAYELRHGGEDKISIYIIDVESGRVLPDRLQSGHPRGFTFALDNSGYFYCHQTSFEAQEHRICLHLFNGPRTDRIVFRAARSQESRLILTADKVHLGAIHTCPKNNPSKTIWIARHDDPGNWHPISSAGTLPFHPILRCGRLFALHYQGAPNGKLVELTDEGYESSVIIPEQSTGILQLVIAGNTAYAEYLDRFVPSIRCWNFSGTERACIAAPTDGTVHLLPSRLSDERVVFYSHESFTQRPTIFEYEPGSALSKPWHHQAPVQDPQPTFIERNTYRSTDSKMVPITLVRKKTGAPAPVVMTSYGGFGVPSTPQFSVLATIMIELGATFALPHIRGGGEFGREWGQAGRGRNRQVSFDDFLSAAEWLRKEGITEPKRLAIFGGSNSGLLVGAAMTQKPHLFCAVLCISPLLDMVRYEFFDQAQRWKHEYGTVSDPDDFRALYAYSPYHHVDIRINYPSTLFVSGDRDDRCDPAHARKMAARLRQREAQRAPILIDYSDERGHSPTMPLSVRVEALTRRIGFLCRELHLPVSGLEPL